MALPFVFLSLAICAVWLPLVNLGPRVSVPPWTVFFVVAIAVGLAVGVLAPTALVSLAGLAALAWGSTRRSGAASIALGVLACCVALALSLHLLPGFNNPKLISGLQLSDNAVPLTKYLNFDKGAAGLVLLAAFARRVTSFSELKLLSRHTFMAVCLTSLVVFPSALAVGYVSLDFKLPAITLTFLAAQLFFTCVTEEAFFRGILQERLMQVLQRWPALRWLPVAISALLFGLAHAGGGPTFVILATLCGAGYALVYFYSRRIEASIITHFMLNGMHFLLFTYPALSR